MTASYNEINDTFFFDIDNPFYAFFFSIQHFVFKILIILKGRCLFRFFFKNLFYVFKNFTIIEIYFQNSKEFAVEGNFEVGERLDGAKIGDEAIGRTDVRRDKNFGQLSVVFGNDVFFTVGTFEFIVELEPEVGGQVWSERVKGSYENWITDS